MSISPADLGAWLRSRRVELGLTQNELARRVRVGRQWIVRLEAGNERAELAPLLRTIFEFGLELRLDPADDRADDLDQYVRSYTRSSR